MKASIEGRIEGRTNPSRDETLPRLNLSEMYGGEKDRHAQRYGEPLSFCALETVYGAVLLQRVALP